MNRSFKLGYLAFFAKSRNNPYHQGTTDYRLWFAGWDEAKRQCEA